MKTPILTEGEKEQVLAGRFLGGDIVPLDSLSAPLVGEMQTVIRLQQALLQEQKKAIVYLLKHKCSRPELQRLLFATEAESQLVAAVAGISGQSVADTAKEFDAFYSAEDEE